MVKNGTLLSVDVVPFELSTDYPWIIHGLSIDDYPWIIHRLLVHELSIDYPWIIHRLSMDYYP